MGVPPRLEQTGAAAVAVATLLAESALLVVVARGDSLPMLLVGHVLVIAAGAAWAFRPARRRTRYALLLWIATAACGPLGAAGVLLAMGLHWHYARRVTGIDEWHAMLFPPTKTDGQADLWRRIGQRASDLSGDQPVTPFLDVLAFGSVPQRQSVIAIIVQQFHPAFAPALKRALRDEHNVIRVQAATAIARLENEFLERTMRLEAAVREAPDSAAAMLALANHYDDQAFAGLLDATREQDCRVRAADGYTRYLQQHPHDDTVRFRLARLQHRRGLWPEAERLFRQVTEAGHPGARQWFMETLFVQSRFAELRAVAAPPHGAVDGGLAPEIAEATALWSGAACEREAAA